jgi:hypothetical protein
MEAAAIVSAVPKATDLEDFQRLVYAVFVRFFDERGAGEPSAYEAISREIWAASVSLRTK